MRLCVTLDGDAVSATAIYTTYTSNRSYQSVCQSDCQLGLSLTKNSGDKLDKDCNKIFICSLIKKEIKFINKAHQTIFKHLIKVA